MSCNGLRILSDNVADTAAMTVPGTASGMGAQWLKTEPRGEFCRVLSGTATITVELPADRSIGCVAIPVSNLSASSRWRVRLIHASAGIVSDSGWQYAAPGPLVKNWHVRMPVNVSAYGDVLTGNDFAFGATCSALWFAENSVCRRVLIDIEDPLRTHLDIARLVLGPYVSPRYGAAYGAMVGMIDQSTNTDTASGDVRISRGPRRRSVSFDLAWIDERDRPMLLPLLRNGIGKRHFVSLLPDHEEPTIVQTHQLWGVLQQQTAMAWMHPTMHQSNYEFREG